VLTGIPLNPSGRHSGCQIEMDSTGSLWIGTGDAASEATPQDLNNLGGKILRITRDGAGVEGNQTEGDDRIYSFGHRNTQGLALQTSPADESFGFSAEHGSDRDDEINPLRPGNFGWQPGQGYNEASPMTDTEAFPEAIKAIWSSGEPTIAVSGLTFLSGNQWKDWNGALAMGVLKDKQLRILLFADENRIAKEETRFLNEFGRIRAVVQGPDGNLYLSTDNGSADQIIKVTPN
jgi:glucose/arabinose dehydrogenase